MGGKSFLDNRHAVYFCRMKRSTKDTPNHTNTLHKSVWSTIGHMLVQWCKCLLHMCRLTGVYLRNSFIHTQTYAIIHIYAHRITFPTLFHRRLLCSTYLITKGGNLRRIFALHAHTYKWNEQWGNLQHWSLYSGWKWCPYTSPSSWHLSRFWWRMKSFWRGYDPRGECPRRSAEVPREDTAQVMPTGFQLIAGAAQM